MANERSSASGSFTLEGWGEGGLASLAATGADRRAALEAALQAVMTLAAGMPAPETGDAAHSAPIRGEGSDLRALFADLLAELSEQLAYFGTGWHDLSLDGVVKGGDATLIAWGYVRGVSVREGTSLQLRLHDFSASEEPASRRIVIRATLTREE